MWLWASTVLRWFSRIAAALLCAIVLLILGVSAYLGTRHGRARLSSAVVADLDRALPGGISVRELERFSLTEVVVGGISLRAPAGGEVLTIGRARARLAPWSLLCARLEVTELSLEDGMLDLRFSGDARRSLASALVDPEEAPTPQAGGRALELLIEAARLAHWRVRVPSGAGSRAREVQLRTATVRLHVGSELRLDIEPVEARLLERGRNVGAFVVRGQFRSQSVSELAIDGDLSGMRLGLGLTLGAPGHPVSRWKDLPFAIELRASELTPARLRRFTPARLPWRALGGPLAVQLELRGVPEAFAGTGTVETPGGPLTLHARSHDFSRLELDIRTDRLALARVLSSLPDWRVQGQLTFSVERDRSARMQIESRASLSIDEHPLPRATLRAERDTDAPWQFEMALDDRWLALSGQGSWANGGTGRASALGWVSTEQGVALARVLGLTRRWGLPPSTDGIDAQGRLESSLELTRNRSGHLDVHATLGSRELRVGRTRLERLAVELTLAGSLDQPRLRLDGQWRASARGSLQSTPGRLQLEGGPQRYQLEWSSGSLGFGSFAGSAWLEREAGARRFALTANGHYGSAPWRLAIRDARLWDAGQVSLPRAELELWEQRFSLHGRYAGADSQLVLDLDDVNVGRLLEPLHGPSELTGSLSGRIEARGDLQHPELLLDVQARQLGLSKGATLDAHLDGTLDAKRGVFAVRGRAREHVVPSAQTKPRIDVAFDASGQVEPSKPWPQSLRAGDQRARIDLTKLDSRALRELVGAELPVSFDVDGSVDVNVRRGVATLGYGVTGRLGFAADGKSSAETDRSWSARIQHSLRYEAGRAETDLSLSDGEGPWLELHGSVQPFADREPSLAELVRLSKADWARHGAAAAWRVDLDARRRSLHGLPAPAWLRSVSGAALGARLVAHRERGKPPVGELTFDLAGAPRDTAAQGAALDGARCSSSLLTSHGHLSFHAGQFEAELTALDAGKRKLQLTSSGELDLAAWLAGQTRGSPRLEVIVDAAALPLERLPFVCESLRGELTAQGRVRDPFGQAQATADVRLARFSLGSEQTVDVQARLSLDRARLELAGKVLATGRESSFQIHVPRPSGSSARAGVAPTPSEISINLSELPLAPLVPLDGPLSNASGHLSGRLRASSGAGKPQLSGKLRLDGVGLTITELAQPLSDITGDLDVSDGVLTVERLSARDGDGALELSGSLKLASSQNFDARLELVARKFPLRQSGEIVAQTSAKAKIDAAWRPERNQLRVEVKEFDTWLERREPSRGMPLAPHPDLRVRPASASDAAHGPAESRGLFASTEATRPAPPLAIQIDAARHFWVKRADFAFKLSADLDIAIQPARAAAERPSVSVSGQLRFERGYMEMMGKTFEVRQGGSLRFTGGMSAVLDLTVQYDDRRSSQRVVIHLQGSVEAPKLDFSVDGEKVSAGEAFQAIYGSSKTSEDDVEPEARASQIISALMAGVLTTSIRRKLGSMAPILSVDPADADRGDQVRAGFELDGLIPGFLRSIVTGVYVEGTLSSEKPSDQSGTKDVQTGVLIELYFPYDFVSSGRYGPDATWSLDIGWQPRGR